MKKLKLVRPSDMYFVSYVAAYNEDVEHRLGQDEFFCPPDIVIAQAKKYFKGTDLPEGYVASSMLWAVEGKTFVGCVDVRHELTPKLLAVGGHIGYEVRYSLCNRGYGTKVLGLALDYARKKLGLRKVLVTCDDDNIASARVIEKNGGVLENIASATDENGKQHTVRRYWLSTNKNNKKE